MFTCDELEFGLRDDKIVLINEILPEENGNKCGCVCPHCHQPLQARTQGKKRRPHFAHIRDACDTKAARETALHMLAKQVLSEKREILFPGIEYRIEELEIPNLIALNYAHGLSESVWCPKPHIIKPTKIEIEKSIDDLIPDCVIYDGEIPCIIEFAVTHFIDDEKYEKLEKLGFATIEIDLRECYKRESTREEIEKAVLYEPSNRTWVYYPWEDKAKELATDYYIRWFAAFRTQYPGIAVKADLEHRKYVEQVAQDSKKEKKPLEDTKQEDEAVVNDDAFKEAIDDQILRPESNSAVSVNKEEESESVCDPIGVFIDSLGDYDFGNPEEIYDSNGNRLLKCTECGEIKLSTEMAYYQYGLGLCKLCSRKLK